jgi:hypothetical protein
MRRMAQVVARMFADIRGVLQRHFRVAFEDVLFEEGFLAGCPFRNVMDDAVEKRSAVGSVDVCNRRNSTSMASLVAWTVI